MLELSWFICGMLYFLLYCYLFYILLCKKTKITKSMIIKLLFCSIIMGIISIFFQIDKSNYFMPYIYHIYIFICLIFIFNEKFVKTLIITFCCIVITFISELFFDLFVSMLLKINLIELNSNWCGFCFSNISILLLGFLSVKIVFIKNFFLSIINWYNKNEYKSLFILVVFLMIILTFLLYNNFIKLLPASFLWITNLFCISVLVFVIGFFKEKSNNNRITTEYDQLLNYVQKYEKLIEEKSKNQHEYKNQLVIIKGLVNKTNKKALNYIDDLYKNETDDSDMELLKKLQYLPQGGLKGLIYYKVEEMINKKIDVYVDVSEQIKMIKMTKVFKDNLQDISKVLGVYLDNAIEATLLSNKKYIIIEVYPDNGELVFSISNTYTGIINLNKVDKEGYTTKGSGKGYGLSLVKDIINHNKNIDQKRELNGIYYVQKLYIKK